MRELRTIVGGAASIVLLMMACDDAELVPPSGEDAGTQDASVDAAPLDGGARDARPDADANEDEDETGVGTIVLAPLSPLVLGGNTSCLASAAGKLRCWGFAGYGSLGVLIDSADPDKASLGDQTGEMPPADARFLAPGERVVQASLAPNDAFGCVVTDKKRVRCFGSAPSPGMLGTQDDVIGDDAADYPAPELDLGADIVQVSAGGSHACALTVAGKVRCWGGNSAGELGDGSTTTRVAFPPPDVVLPAAMARVYASSDATCAITSGGKVYCWGANYYGRFARGLGGEELVGDAPGEMPPPPSDFGGLVKELALGANHVCALLVTGEVRCAGDNTSSPLGIVSGLSAVGDKAGHFPLTSAKVGSDVAHVAAGGDATCVLAASGEVRCFGSNTSGRCAAGDDPIAGDRGAEFPRSPVALGESAIAIAAGHGGHFCALLAGDRVRCWGNGGNGQLGHGATSAIGDDEEPASVPALAIFP